MSLGSAHLCIRGFLLLAPLSGLVDLGVWLLVSYIKIGHFFLSVQFVHI